MNSTKRIKITDLNPNLICVLCGGYLIDATTLTECLHSFCKKCIVRYLESSKHCPVCDVMVHKTRPHQNIRSDKTLQDLVYKLVPGLYKNEMKRRRDYYTEHPEAAPKKVGEARGDENAERIIYTEDENFSLALHFCSEGVKDERSVRTLTLPEIGASAKEPPKDVRYLQCPASVTIGILKKFIRLKYELPHHYQIDVFHTDEALRDEYTLMDVAYIYTWRRREPLKLNYSVYENTIKRRRLDTPLTRVGLTFKPHVKTEGKQSAKHDANKCGKQDSKPAKLDKPPVKQEKQTPKQDTKSPVKQEADSPKSGEKDEKSDSVKQTSDKADANAEGEVVVGHVSEATEATIPPSLPALPGKKFFHNKPSKPAYGVKVLQSSKPNALSTKIKAVVGNGVKSSPVKKAVQNKTISVSNSQPACEANKNASVQNVNDSAKVGQSSVGNPTVQTGKTSAGVAGTNSVDQSGKNVVVLGLKSGEAGAAGAAASAADVATKTSRQLQPPPAASPATSVTASPSSAPLALTSSSRSCDSLTVTQSSTTVTSLSSITVTGSAASKSGLPTPLLPSSGVLTVSASNNTASAAAGAAAAGGDASPAPAALAASSSPSPPMSTSTASHKDAGKQFVTPTPSAPVTSVPDSPVPSPKPVSSAPATRPTTSSPQTSATPTPAHRLVTASGTNTKPFAPSLPGHTVTPSVLSPKSGSASDKSLSSSPATKKVRKSSPARAPDNISSKFANPNTSNNNNNNDANIVRSTAASIANGGLKVPVGSPTVVSCNIVPKGAAGRVCNGMPPVVTRMPRVSNAATSVNTLNQNQTQKQPSSGTTTLQLTTLKLPVPGSSGAPKQASTSSSTQKQTSSGISPQKQPAVDGTAQKQSAAANTIQKPSTPEKQATAGGTPQKASNPGSALQRSVALSRPSGASTPIPIQPAGMAPTSHSLVRASPGSAIAVAMARRASEMQQAFVQQQQQQLLIQQHLLEQQRLQQFLQQQQLLNLQVAAAARWKTPQASTTLTPIPISQAGIVVNAASFFNGTSTKNATSPASAEAPTSSHGRAEEDGEKNKRQAMGNGQSKHQLPALCKKPPEPSPSKKKISDIANSLHKKMSQNSANPAQQKPSTPTSAADQRPPNAHSTGGKRPENGTHSQQTQHGQTQQAHSASSAKSPTAVAEPSASKGEDDQPLNLSLVKESPRANGGLPAAVSS